MFRGKMVRIATLVYGIFPMGSDRAVDLKFVTSPIGIVVMLLLAFKSKLNKFFMNLLPLTFLPYI